MYKNAAHARLLFCQSKPIAFFAVLVDVAVVVAQAPHFLEVAVLK